MLTPAAPAHDSDEDALYTIPLTQIINGGPGTTTVTDADPDDALGGIAVIGLSGSGNWYYSLNGTVFNTIGVVDDDAALLLPYSSYLRFEPGAPARPV